MAICHFFGLTSTPTMCVAPTALHAWTTAKPTAPSPKTATDEPYSTFAVVGVRVRVRVGVRLRVRLRVRVRVRVGVRVRS